MIEIYLDDQLLYYQGDTEKTVTNAVLKQALNDADSLEFDVYRTHPLYGSFTPRRSMVKVLQDGSEIFYGEVREITDELNFCRHIYAVGELAFLFDSIQPQAKYQNITPTALFTAMVNLHNAQVEEKKRFTVGMVTVTDPNDSLYRFTNYEDTLSAIRDKLCDRLDGFLRIRKSSGVRYIDLVRLEDYGQLCGQTIEFGENLLEYSCNTSAQDIATALIPLGARQDESEIDGLDAYLTVESVNDGKDYIYNETAVNNFGWVKVVKHWDDITLPANLLRAGQDWLTSAQYATLTLELNAVDLSVLNANMDSMDVGDRIRATAEPFGMDTVLPLQKKTTYLQDPSKNYIVLGSTMQKSYTQQASKAVTELEYEMPQQNSILDAAKRNALAMLLDETQGGFVVYEYDADNEYIVAINICNALTIEASTKRWRWGQNGFGYMERQNTTDAWGNIGIAMTMDGEIVADYIKTGEMSAYRIKGGVLTLGGNGNGNGRLVIVDASGNTIGSWDNNGLNARQGYIGNGVNGWNIHDTYINTQNGPTSKTDTSRSGAYIGVDGICFNDDIDPTYRTFISKGLLVTQAFTSGSAVIGPTGSTSQNLTVTGKAKISNMLEVGAAYIKDGGMTVKGDIGIEENGSVFRAVTGLISWATSAGGYALNVKNGIIVSIVKPS